MKILQTAACVFMMMFSDLLRQLQAVDEAGDRLTPSCVADSDVYTLANGLPFPAVSFGTAGLGSRTEAIVKMALAEGFRGFDTAQANEWYDEAAVGRALRSAFAEGVISSRKDVFVTTKMHPRDHGYDSTRQRVTESRVALNIPAASQNNKQAQLAPIDLFLLHYADCWSGLNCKSELHVVPGATWRDSWRALEAEYEEGNVRAIGVSNFNTAQLRELLSMAKVKPHVLQSWMDPLHQSRDIRALCEKEDIHFTAYSTLGGQWRESSANPVLNSEVVTEVAAEAGLSATLTVLAWALQRNVSILPRSANHAHIRENARLLGQTLENEDSSEQRRPRLNDDQLKRIDGLDGRVNQHRECAAWAAAGECDKNPGYMRTMCRASCKSEIAPTPESK